MFSKTFPIVLASLMLVALFAVPASADVVVADDQIVNGNSCFGTECVNGEVFGPAPLLLKTTDTPAIRFNQTNGGGFTAQIWDIGANEANFFVRDATGGSKLVLRAFPGAESDLLRLENGGYATTYGQFALVTDYHTNKVAFDTSGVLTNLRDLTFESYRSTDSTDTHLRPVPAAFASKFGGSTNKLSVGDLSTVALAGVKELNARVDGLAPATDLGPTSSQIAALQAENAKLKKQQASQAKSLKKLQKQIKKLARRR